MSDTLVKDLLDAGIHFGQRRSNWDPRMKPYIWGQRNRIHIIDIRQTVRGLLLAKKYITKTVASGKDVVFVGTKRQAKGSVEEFATGVGMPWVTERWLGGTLTNFRTIRERLKRLEVLEKLVESGEINSYSKKMTSQLMREKQKITRNLQGIREMNKLPGAVIVIDTKRETNALREARTLRIPTIALIDTDGNPGDCDIPVPGNDDSMRSIAMIMREFTDAVKDGLAARTAVAEGVDDAGEQQDGEKPKRRSSRVKFASDAAKPESTDTEVATAAVADPTK
jgi:small subunit ribosomal protein S2